MIVLLCANRHRESDHRVRKEKCICKNLQQTSVSEVS